MTVILAIDPGTTRSAWLVLVGGRPEDFGILPNAELLAHLRDNDSSMTIGVETVAIEQIEPRYGLSPGWETLDTARWVGRFQEAARPIPVTLLKRSDILRHLGVVTRGPGKTTADSGVRAALIDRFGGAAGKETAIGRKAAPGPLHGISTDVWSALSVAVTYLDQEGIR